MSNEWFEFFSGIIFGIILSLITLSSIGIVPRANEAINNCQKDLPRSQICILTAVPEGEK